MLNEHPMTVSDSRNDEAKKHKGHNLIVVKNRDLHVRFVEGECKMVDVICLDCNKQFKLYNWSDKEQK